jgi:signal transduction histidine kinase
MPSTPTLDAALGFLTRAVLLATSLLTLAAFVRKGGRERGVIAAMFGSLGTTTLVSWFVGFTGYRPLWLSMFAVMALLAHPLLMVLLVRQFQRVPTWFVVVACVGWVVATAAYAVSASRGNPHLANDVALPIVIYFCVGELYAAYALVTGAVRSKGIAQKRLVFAGTGTGLLGLVILLAGVNIVLPSNLQIYRFATSLLAFTAILAFYLGFSAPAWLRRLWLQAEIAKFTVKQAGPRSVAARADVSTDLLASAALSLAGGEAAWVALAAPGHWRVHQRTGPGPAAHSEWTGSAAMQLATWLESDRSSTLVPAGTVAREAAERLALKPERFVLVLRIHSGARPWGLALVSIYRPSLFFDETIQTLEVLASQACMAYEAEAAQAEIQAANKELEAFAYSVSHDLRAPLRAMDGFSRILLEDSATSLSPAARHDVELIISGAREMGTMVDDLLRFSRLGKQALNRQEVQTRQLAEQVAQEQQLQETGRHVQVRVGDLPACNADPGLLKQVFANLIGNAVKYTRKKPHADIEVGWTDADGGAYFVKDNGVGFSMTHAHNLFGVFQRLHRAEEYEGTGVGLAIVQRIVARHGGRIWAQAEVDQGATFYFTLKGGKP